MKRPHILALSLVLSFLVGCSANPGAGGGSTPRPQHNQISSEELQGTQFRNAYELIQALRPNWLQARGQHSLTNTAAGQVMVYLDGNRVRGPEILRQIPTSDLHVARYLTATEATARYGTDHSGGAIVNATRRR
jgi:hypothetical protein